MNENLQVIETDFQQITKKIITRKETIEKEFKNANTNIEKRTEHLKRKQIPKNGFIAIGNSKLRIKCNENVKVIHP